MCASLPSRPPVDRDAWVLLRRPHTRGLLIILGLFILGVAGTMILDATGWDLAWVSRFYTPGGVQGGWTHGREQPWAFLFRSWRDAGPYPCGRGGRALCSVKIGESSAGICKKLPGGDSNCSSRSRIAGQWDFKALLGPAPTRGYHSERRHTGISQSVDAGWGKGRQIFPLRPLFYGLLAGLRRGLLFFPSITVRLCVGGRDCVRRASWRDKDDPGRSFSNRCALGWNFDAHDYNDPLLFHFPSARANRLILTFVGREHIPVGCLSCGW